MGLGLFENNRALPVRVQVRALIYLHLNGDVDSPLGKRLQETFMDILINNPNPSDVENQPQEQHIVNEVVSAHEEDNDDEDDVIFIKINEVVSAHEEDNYDEDDVIFITKVDSYKCKSCHAYYTARGFYLHKTKQGLRPTLSKCKVCKYNRHKREKSTTMTN
jgi:hypothetical protein